MKKLSFLLAFVAGTVAVNAQSKTFKPFKADLAIGYAIPGGSGAKGGVLFAVEPKYALNDNIAIGLRFEGAVMARAAVDQTGNTVVGDVKASGSYLLTGDYYLNTNKFRPFVGVGAGLYSSAAAKIDNTTGEVSAGTSFGAAPRAGFELGHFRMAVEYNIAGKTGTINNNYMGIKLGFFVGGGRR
ncbi:MAG TPA: OmpW family outer membrane protein [Flavisolibacter sp.]|nr:OmpW family outer membrane protein [Flavisolibacter sp.]